MVGGAGGVLRWGCGQDQWNAAEAVLASNGTAAFCLYYKCSRDIALRPLQPANHSPRRLLRSVCAMHVSRFPARDGTPIARHGSRSTGTKPPVLALALTFYVTRVPCHSKSTHPPVSCLSPHTRVRGSRIAHASASSMNSMAFESRSRVNNARRPLLLNVYAHPMPSSASTSGSRLRTVTATCRSLPSSAKRKPRPRPRTQRPC